MFPFYILFFWPRGMRDLSSPGRHQTRTPCIGRQSLNHWIARDVPGFTILIDLRSPFCSSIFRTISITKQVEHVLRSMGLMSKYVEYYSWQELRGVSSSLLLSSSKTYSGFPSGPVAKNPPANAGDRVPSLVWEDLTCLRATKPMDHNY